MSLLTDFNTLCIKVWSSVLMVIFTYTEAYLPPKIVLLDLVGIPQMYFMFWKLAAVCLPQILIVAVHPPHPNKMFPLKEKCW